MKVFHYNPETAQKGELVGDIPYCHSTRGMMEGRPKLPSIPGQDWYASDHATYLDGSPIRFDFPVCFCLGRLYGGETATWHWVALMPTPATTTHPL